MKNRTEEYWTLVSELSQPPQELEGSVERARKRARRTAPLRRLAAPAASLAAVAATFVLLVNVSVPFALACSGVPIVRELAAAVAFSPSLSAAVAHDYVQYIGQSQTVDGVTVNLEYAIVDPVQAVFFYTTQGGMVSISPKLITPEGEPIGGYATSHAGADGDAYGGMENLTLSFTAGESRLPERFTLEFYGIPGLDLASGQAEAVAPEAVAGDGPDVVVGPREEHDTIRFAFDVTLDPSRIVDGDTVEVGRWVELDGQRILVDRLELYPTRTVVYLGEDSANTAWLRSLKFFFTDGKGNRYDDQDGVLTASGEEESNSYLTYYFQSFYYAAPENLTLHITKAEWLEKEREHVVLDLNTGACPGLPEGTEVHKVTRSGKNVSMEFHAPLERKGFGQTFGGAYWDPRGIEHTFNQWGAGDVYDEDTGKAKEAYEILYLQNYAWDTVELELSYTSVSVYDEPVRVAMG